MPGPYRQMGFTKQDMNCSLQPPIERHLSISLTNLRLHQYFRTKFRFKKSEISRIFAQASCHKAFVTIQNFVNFSFW